MLNPNDELALANFVKRTARNACSLAACRIEIVNVLHAIDAVVRCALADVAREQNYSCPVNRLPAELLCLSFALLDVPTLCKAAEVCTHWRQAALGDASLWTRLRLANFRSTDVGYMLARSKDLPVDISVLPQEGILRSDNPRFTGLSEHMHHVGSLRMTTALWDIDDLRYALSCPAPALRRLLLSFDPVCGELPAVTLDVGLFNETAPLLEHVELRNAVIAAARPSIPAFANVKRLDLLDGYDDTMRVAELLRHFPAVVSLGLVVFPMAQSNPDARVHLPRLQRVSITNYHDGADGTHAPQFLPLRTTKFVEVRNPSKALAIAMLRHLGRLTAMSFVSEAGNAVLTIQCESGLVRKLVSSDQPKLLEILADFFINSDVPAEMQTIVLNEELWFCMHDLPYASTLVIRLASRRDYERAGSDRSELRRNGGVFYCNHYPRIPRSLVHTMVISAEVEQGFELQRIPAFELHRLLLETFGDAAWKGTLVLHNTRLHEDRQSSEVQAVLAAVGELVVDDDSKWFPSPWNGSPIF